jgi:hypothetical protein
VADWSQRDAFEDILLDCYKFAILDRLTALQEQLKIKPNVDGLISRNVSNFLLERQRKHDPIGYAVFLNVHDAVNELEAQPSPTQPALSVKNRDRWQAHQSLDSAMGGATAPPQIATQASRFAGS